MIGKPEGILIGGNRVVGTKLNEVLTTDTHDITHARASGIIDDCRSRFHLRLEYA